MVFVTLCVCSLSDLQHFISLAEAGLSQQVVEGDYGGLVGVMGHLLAVKERQSTTDAMFEPLQQTIALLKVYEQELPDLVYKQLEVWTLIVSPCMFSYTLSLLFFLIAHLCPLIHHLSLLLSPHLPRLLPVCLFILQELPEKWNNVRKQAVLVKQQVAPLQAIEVTNLRRKCASFDVEQHTFREHFRTNGPFR